MIITHVTSEPNIRYAYLNIFPDQFKSAKEKEDPSWIKNTMDYFANVAFSQYRKHRRGFVKNYDLMKGIIDYTDFYEEMPEVQSFTDTLMKDTELPAYVKHYPILNPPVNTMIGELSKRPDTHKVRAFDDDSKSEELEYKTNIVQQLIIQEGKRMLAEEMQLRGVDTSQLNEDEFNKLSLDKVSEYLTSYTSLGERWGNSMLTALKVAFNAKEKSEDAFRDLLIASREFYEIYEDNSKMGFNLRVINPKNQWQLGTPDAKYTSAISGASDVPYAVGTATVMEISQIMQECPDLTKDEIDLLRKSMEDFGLINVRESNLFTNKTGTDSIQYDTYNRLIMQERMMIEGEMKENRDELKDWLGLSNSTASFGYKYTVVKAYWMSKTKVGKLTYFDVETGAPEVMMVDETYVKSPNEISIEWGWINQIYQGTRIGPNIYHVKPFKLFDYMPIIGVIHEIKNTTARSLVDLMKPFQVLYNICMNQLFQLLEKEIGNVASISIRRVPRSKDGDAQDDLDMFEAEAKKRGIMYDDDSPENTKGGVSNQTVARNVDLTRSNEIQSRYNLATQLKQECWELIGMNRQRLGASQASSTATSNQNDLVQSFSQTEPYFAAHEYVLNQVYQALLDAAQYVEGSKPNSTVSYITNQGEQAFLEVAGVDIKLRDLKVFVTSRAEDMQLLQEFRQLSQAMLQNGASVYDVSVLYTTNSLRQMQKIFKDLKDKQEEMNAQNGQLEQSKLQQEAELKQAELEQAEQHHQDDMLLKKYEIDTKANTDLATAEIKTYFQAPATDSDGNGTPDIMDIAGHSLKIQQGIEKADLANKTLAFNMQKHMDDQRNKKVEQQLAKEKIANEKARTKAMSKNPKLNNV
jgi:hypothetical protein